MKILRTLKCVVFIFFPTIILAQKEQLFHYSYEMKKADSTRISMIVRNYDSQNFVFEDKVKSDFILGYRIFIEDMRKLGSDEEQQIIDTLFLTRASLNEILNEFKTSQTHSEFSESLFKRMFYSKLENIAMEYIDAGPMGVSENNHEYFKEFNKYSRLFFVLEPSDFNPLIQINNSAPHFYNDIKKSGFVMPLKVECNVEIIHNGKSLLKKSIEAQSDLTILNCFFYKKNQQLDCN